MQKQDSLVFINNSVSRLILILFAFVACIAFTGLGSTGLFDVDEAIFAEASYEMIETGDFVTPTYNGEPRYHKPPLIYWIQAASMYVFGKTAFAARLPSALFGFLTLLVFYCFLERMTENKRFALTASAILGVNLSFYLVSHAATADMALNLFVLATTMTFLASLYAEKRDAFAPIVGGLLLGLAFLCKGPVALMVPCLVIGVATFMKEDVGENFVRINPITALIALLVAASPWIVLMIQAKGFDFFKEFWLVHNIGRFTEAMGNTHTTSKLYYVGVILVGLFPWVLLLPSAVLWVSKRFLWRLRTHNVMEALPALGLIWFLAVVVFFSFSQTKLPHYILPAYPGAALLLAGRLEDIWSKPLCKWQALWMVPYTVLLSSLFFILPYAPDIALGNFDALPTLLKQFVTLLGLSSTVDLEAQSLALWQQTMTIPKEIAFIGILFFIGAVLGFGALTSKDRRGILFLTVFTGGALVLSTLFLVPTVYGYLQKELAVIGEHIKEEYVKGETKVYHVAIHQPSVRFVSGAPFVSIGRPHMIPTTDKHAFYVYKKENLRDMYKYLPENTREPYCGGGYCLTELKQEF